MRFRALVGFVLGALVCAGGTARLTADAEPPPAPAQPTPAERAEKVLAALPAPSASDPWSFEADVHINGVVQGSARFTLTPEKQGEADLWKASDGVRFGPAEAPAVVIAMEAVLDARLTGLSGKTVSTSPGEPPVTFSWRRTPLGYGLERQEGEQPIERVMLRDAPYLKTSLGGLVRFCQALPAEPATYAVSVLPQDANVGMTAETRILNTTLEVMGVKPFAVGKEQREAWTVRRNDQRGDEVFLAFDPKTRALLSITNPVRKMEVRRKGLELAAKAGDEAAIDWKAPAKSADVAALQAGRAFATADFDALEKLTWWPSALEALKKDPQLAALDDTARKAALFAGLKQNLTANPAAMIEFALQGARKELVVEDAEAGRKRVKFPPIFRSLVIVVLEVEGTWYLAEFPMSPPPEKEEPPPAPPTPDTPK